MATIRPADYSLSGRGAISGTPLKERTWVSFRESGPPLNRLLWFYNSSFGVFRGEARRRGTQGALRFYYDKRPRQPLALPGRKTPRFWMDADWPSPGVPPLVVERHARTRQRDEAYGRIWNVYTDGILLGRVNAETQASAEESARKKWPARAPLEVTAEWWECQTERRERRLENLVNRDPAGPAYHEAGHAVVAHRLGGVVTAVSIKPRECESAGLFDSAHDSIGRMSWSIWTEDEEAWRTGTPQGAERRSLVYLAGRVAQARYRGKKIHWAAIHDPEVEQARALSRRFVEGDARSAWEGLLQKTAQLVVREWPLIEHVATALIRYRELDRPKIQRLLNPLRPKRSKPRQA